MTLERSMIRSLLIFRTSKTSPFREREANSEIQGRAERYTKQLRKEPTLFLPNTWGHVNLLRTQEKNKMVPPRVLERYKFKHDPSKRAFQGNTKSVCRCQHYHWSAVWRYWRQFHKKRYFKGQDGRWQHLKKHTNDRSSRDSHPNQRSTDQ